MPKISLKLSSKEKMIISVSALLIIVIMVGAYINDRNFGREALSQNKKQVTKISMGLAAMIEKEMKGIHDSVKEIATLIEPEIGDLNQIREYLKISHKTISSHISSLAFVDRHGILQANFPEETITKRKINEYRNSPFIRKALAAGKTVISHRFLNKKAELEVRLIVPTCHHQIKGVLVANININGLLRENISYFGLENGDDYHIFLTESDGDLIAFPNVETSEFYPKGNLWKLSETCTGCHEKDHFQDIEQAAETKAPNTTKIYVNQKGKTDLRVSVPIKLPQDLWVLTACVSIEKVFQLIRYHQRQAFGLAAGLGIVLFGGNIFLFVTRRRQIKLENEAAFLRREEELTKQSRKAFGTLMMGTASATGADFFDALLKNLCELEEMDYGFICRLDLHEKGIKGAWVLSTWYKGKIEKDYEKDLTGGPCEKTVKEGFSCYTQKMADLFPGGEKQEKHGFQSYIGIPLKSGEGEVIGVLCVFHSRPISLKPHTEEVFQILSQRAVAEIQRLDAVKAAMKSQEQLLHAQKMDSIGNLAGGIAHDFNNLLTGIIGHAAMLKRQIKEKDKIYDHVEGIEKSSQKASDLVRKLLGFGRRGKMQIEVFDLNTILKETMVLLESSITKSIVIDWQPSCEPLPAEGDPGQIEQVVLNLCFNARDAMDKSGILKVVSRPVNRIEKDCGHQDPPPGKYVYFMICDTGCGMDEETIKRIYEPFFTTKPKYKGTGLGLAMVYGIIRNHQGFIYVNSQPGSGTTFEIFLKRSPKPITYPAEKDFEAQPSTDESNKVQTILLVDDEENILEITGMMLSETGYRVIEAKDGTEAVKTYRKKGAQIDLILMDHIMPGMMGKEAARKILEMDPGARIILTSGYAKDGLYSKEEAKIIAGFLKKPYNRKILLKKIKDILYES